MSIKPFISLEEFLLLPDHMSLPDRPWRYAFYGPEWILRYKIAKESYETYGDNPLNGPVEMLVGGHGCLCPDLSRLRWEHSLPQRQLVGIDTDSRFFLIHRLERDGREQHSLTERATWWRSFRVAPTKG